MTDDHEPMTGPPGGDDWNAAWTAMKERQQATPGYLSGTEFFGRPEKAERYRKLAAARYDRYTERRDWRRWRSPPARHPRIGAGPGTLAVPLARRGCRVTAVEPSAPMRRALHEHTLREGVTVTLIEGRGRR